jgi:hypothetical protein
VHHPGTALPVSLRSSLVRAAPDQDRLGGENRATAARALENTALNLARPGQSVDPRSDRWDARRVLWHDSGLDRVRSCGRWSIRPDGSVQVRANGAAVGYAGLATCGSPWSCPVCNSKIQAVRRLEVESTLATVEGNGGSAAFGAYTLQHHARSLLDPLWRALSLCWEAVARDKLVRRVRAELGLVGTVRAAEVTHGANGWHPHLHPLHLFAGRVSDGDVARLHQVQERAWIAAAARLGLSAPSTLAQHLQRLDSGAGAVMGDYFVKSTYAAAVSAAWELTSTQTKSRTRAHDSRTPWDLLHEVRTNGDADALDLWHAWERGSKGKRPLTWSKGLRALVGLDREASDDEIATAEVGSAEDTGFTISDWSPVRADPRLGALLLAAIDGGRNWAAGRAFCAEHGIPLLSVAAGRGAL